MYLKCKCDECKKKKVSKRLMIKNIKERKGLVQIAVSNTKGDFKSPYVLGVERKSLIKFLKGGK